MRPHLRALIVTLAVFLAAGPAVSLAAPRSWPAPGPAPLGSVTGPATTDDVRGNAPASPSARAYHATPCPFAPEVIPFAVECGVLTVPEDRADPGDGNVVALHVTIVRAPDREGVTIPTLYLEGGPGVGATSSVVPLLQTQAGTALVAGRDLIVLDQRGTGYSVPRLDCALFSLDRLADPARFLDASTSCHARYAAAGIDLAAYSTASIAADARDLRLALGLDAWDVYAVSYGTTVALELLRIDPDATHAIVLDSPSPPQSNDLLADLRYKDEALRRVFAGCAAEPACAGRHPDLEARFGAAITALNEVPLDLGGGALLTGDLLVFLLTNTAYLTADLVPALPALLDGLLAGDVEPLSGLLAGGEEGVAETDAVAANDGLLLTVYCAEDLSRTNQTDLDELAEGGPVAASLARTTRALLDACAPWDLPSAPLSTFAPVMSDTPALILVGEWGQSTQPALAEETAATLENAEVVVFTGQAHGVPGTAPTTCPADLISAFLEDPTAPASVACTERDYAPIEFGEA